MALRPLLMHRARGLKGPFFCKYGMSSHKIHGVGNFIATQGGAPTPPPAPVYSMLGASPASTDAQNVDAAGNVMNLMPKGVVTATSTHTGLIWSADKDVVFRGFSSNTPVWRGGFWVGDGTVTEDGLEVYASCHPVVTNHLLQSNTFGDIIWAKNRMVLSAGTGDSTVVSEGLETGQHQLLQDRNQITGTEHFSFIAKFVDAPLVGFLLRGGGIWREMLYDIQAGVVHSITAGVDSADIRHLGEGWYLCSAVFSARDDNRVGIHMFSDAGGNSYPGTDRTFLLKHAQIQTTLTAGVVVTTTVSVTAQAVNYTYPAGNIDPSGSEVSLTIDHRGDDVVVMDIGGVSLLAVVSGNLVLSDGVNSLSLAITEGPRVIKASLSATTMDLDLDGVILSGPYVPIAAGLITINEDFKDLTARPYPL